MIIGDEEEKFREERQAKGRWCEAPAGGAEGSLRSTGLKPSGV